MISTKNSLTQALSSLRVRLASFDHHQQKNYNCNTCVCLTRAAKIQANKRTNEKANKRTSEYANKRICEYANKRSKNLNKIYPKKSN